VCEDISVDNAPFELTITTSDLVPIPDAAKQLGIHFATLYRWIHKGKVRPFRIGNQVFITATDLKSLKEEKREK